MAARVTEEEVQAIMPDFPDDLSPFMTMATLLVDEELVDRGLSVARLKEVERWLAAHFAAVNTPLATAEAAGSVSQSNQRGAAGQGLSSTQYGQNAIAMDPSGRLRALSDGSGQGTVYIGSVREPFQTDGQNEEE